MRKNPHPIVVLALLAAVLPMLESCRSSRSPAESHAIAPEKKWEFFTGKLPQLPRGSLYDDQSPAIGSDGMIYVPGSRGLYALLPDGTLKWFHEFSLQERHFPLHFALVDDNGNIWHDQTVQVDRLRGGATELDASGHELPGGISMDRVSQIGEAHNGRVFVGMDGRMFAIRIDGKNAQPDTPMGGYAFSFAPGGSIYATAGNVLEGFSSERFLEWRHDIPAGGCWAPVLGVDGTIYVGCNDGLSAFNPDGSGKWSFAVREGASSPSVAEDGTVYFGSQDKNVYALSTNGRLKWQFATGGEVRSSPAITRNGTIYIGSADNRLYAVGADGKLKWKFTTGGQVFSPTVADDGTIYVQSGDGKIYAIKDAEENGGLSGQWPKLGADLRNTARGNH
jgi:outer membrane protein assembly factor BamB